MDSTRKSILHIKQPQLTALVGIPVLLSSILILVSFKSFLLFHTLAELFAIIIALIMSVVAWQMYPYTRNNYLMFVGCGYFWVGVLDLVHALTYKGMTVFPGADAGTSIDFWIITRYLEATVLLLAPLFLTRVLNRQVTSILFAFVTAGIFIIVMSGNFPETYIDGKGLTTFKINSEYVINLVIALAIYYLWYKRDLLDKRIFYLVTGSMVFTIIAELAFTYYVSVYGLSNLVGHIFKIFSFWLIYVAVVKTTLRDPFAALTRSASTYDAIPDAVIAINQDGIIQQANDAASQLSGLPVTALLNKDSHALFHPASIEKHECPVCKVVKQNIHQDNIQLYWPERKIWLDFALAPMHTDIDVNPVMVQTIRNITRQYESQQELEKHREHLEDLVKERTSTLEQAYDDLKVARDEAIRATKVKSEFLAKMSHELRTPLNSIIGFTGIIKDGLAGPVSDEQAKQLAMVYESATHLLNLINDILDISKVEAGKTELHYESFNLENIFDEVKNVISPLLTSKDKNNIKLVYNLDCQSNHIYSDKGKIRQILLNLLSNAIKFTHKGTVSLTCRLEDSNLYFVVEDTGIGIPEDKQAHIFETFHQVDNSTVRSHEGTGLGLAITKQFIELMGGTISLQSKKNFGTKFEVCIPVKEIKITAEEQLKNIFPENNKVSSTLAKEENHILVIDDDEHTLELMRNYLQKEGYQVTTLSDSRQAVTKVKEIKPLAVTLDVQMPELDGWAILAALKNDNQTSSVPVIMISMQDKKNLGLSLGAVDFLQKPIEPKQLAALLDNISIDNKDVLIIEDRKPDAEMLEIMLNKDGYQVRHASDGVQGLEMIANRQPALILLDLMMPHMSGFEVIQRLRAKKETIGIPIIVVSAKHLTEAEAEYLSENVEKVLVKGELTKNDMLDEVGNALSIIKNKQPGDVSG